MKTHERTHMEFTYSAEARFRSARSSLNSHLLVTSSAQPGEFSPERMQELISSVLHAPRGLLPEA